MEESRRRFLQDMTALGAVGSAATFPTSEAGALGPINHWVARRRGAGPMKRRISTRRSAQQGTRVTLLLF
jgi:hypothetical protein